MKPTNDAIEHCGRHIERIRAEIQRREELRHDTERHRKRLKTLRRYWRCIKRRGNPALLACRCSQAISATKSPGTPERGEIPELSLLHVDFGDAIVEHLARSVLSRLVSGSANMGSSSAFLMGRVLEVDTARAQRDGRRRAKRPVVRSIDVGTPTKASVASACDRRIIAESVRRCADLLALWRHHEPYRQQVNDLPCGVARTVLRIDPAREPQRALRAWKSHLSRAKWMTEHGYEDLLRGRPLH